MMPKMTLFHIIGTSVREKPNTHGEMMSQMPASTLRPLAHCTCAARAMVRGGLACMGCLLGGEWCRMPPVTSVVAVRVPRLDAIGCAPHLLQISHDPDRGVNSHSYIERRPVEGILSVDAVIWLEQGALEYRAAPTQAAAGLLKSAGGIVSR